MNDKRIEQLLANQKYLIDQIAILSRQIDAMEEGLKAAKVNEIDEYLPLAKVCKDILKIDTRTFEYHYQAGLFGDVKLYKFGGNSRIRRIKKTDIPKLMLPIEKDH